jgi:hypothetical protein
VAEIHLRQERIACELPGSTVRTRAEQNNVVALEPETDAVERHEGDSGMTVHADHRRCDTAPGQLADAIRQLLA